MVKSYWEAIGVDLEIKVYEPVTATSRIRERTGYEVQVITWTPHNIPSTPVARVISGNMPPLDYYNCAMYSNPDIDRLYDAAQATLDQGERYATFKEA
ncbi:unnamed protein product, partial [marine sediment metagenome]